MVYLITNQEIQESSSVRLASVQDCVDYCSRISEIGLDTETMGMDPYTGSILTLQLGDYENQFVVDLTTVSINNFKNLLEDKSKIFLGHNLKFDIRFLLHKGIVLKNVYDTYIAEQIIWNGHDEIKKSLDFVCYRYVGVMLDKSIRGRIFKEKLSERVIIYAADDIKYLGKIKEKQLERATKWDLLRAVRMNNMFVPVISYLEYSGFKLDTQKWKSKIEQDKKTLKEKLAELNKYIQENSIKEFIDPQLNLWNENESRVNINWNSPEQVAKFFKILGIDTSIQDPETGELKDTVNAGFLEKQVNKNPIIQTYIDYRAALKRCSTYGENWFRYINPVTGRIHTKFQQWVTTGRMSSGGKDKSSNVDYPNAQNIPADEETRSCIVPEEGYIFINADYDSQEVRVFANFCKDEALIKMFKEGFTDMHSYTAWHIFPKIREKYPELNQETIKLIKKDFPKERQISKLGNFAIQYGGTGYTVAENCNIPIEEGEAFYNAYFQAFKGVKKYFEQVFNRAKRTRVITYNDITREKYFIPNNLPESKIKNASYNYPVQGTSASITKYAGILYYRHLLEENLLFKVKIAIICHDEFLIEVPEELAEQEAKILKECMEKAGELYCQTIKLTATPVITRWWKH